MDDGHEASNEADEASDNANIEEKKSDMVKWFWTKSPTTMVTYSHDISRQITDAFRSGKCNITIEDNGKEYEINFNDQDQISKSGFRRNIKYGCLPMTNETLLKQRKNNIPKSDKLRSDQGWWKEGFKVKMTNLPVNSGEYKLIYNMINSQFPEGNGYNISNIEVVESPRPTRELYFYLNEARLTGDPQRSNVQLMYHGCPTSVVSSILKKGLEPCRGGTQNGSKFGVGAYTSNSFLYSLGFSTCQGGMSNTRKIVVLAVNTGKTTISKNGTIMLPDEFDSGVDNQLKPMINIIFEKRSCPLYVITVNVKRNINDIIKKIISKRNIFAVETVHDDIDTTSCKCQGDIKGNVTLKCVCCGLGFHASCIYEDVKEALWQSNQESYKCKNCKKLLLHLEIENKEDEINNTLEELQQRYEEYLEKFILMKDKQDKIKIALDNMKAELNALYRCFHVAGVKVNIEQSVDRDCNVKLIFTINNIMNKESISIAIIPPIGYPDVNIVEYIVYGTLNITNFVKHVSDKLKKEVASLQKPFKISKLVTLWYDTIRILNIEAKKTDTYLQPVFAIPMTTPPVRQSKRRKKV